MAKIFRLIIVCVCYCTVCAHLIAAHMMRKDLNAKYEWNHQNAPDEFNDDNWNAKQNIQQNGITFRNKENDRVQFANNVGPNNDLKSKLIPQQQQHQKQYEHTKRVKRHAEHSHDSSIDLGNLVEMNPNTRQYIRKLFNQFGKTDDTITLNEFEKLIEKLGLHRLIEEQQLIHHESTSRSTETVSDEHDSNDSHNKTCISSMDLVSQVTSIKKDGKNKENMENYESSLAKIKGQSNTLNSQQPTEPIDNNVTLETIKSIKDNINLDENDFWSLCPILLYQLISPPDSMEHSGCITTPLLPSNSNHDHHVHFEFGEADRKLVWIYASLSIIVASLCGLIGVAVIPCMERRYYQYVLQFFVALAIGTLAGDALLHLMPHAMMSFSTLENNHTNMTYKGLVAALGIIFFFVTERIITMFAEKRKRKQKRDDPPARVRVMRDPDSISVNNSLNGEKQCKHKYSSYPYCYDEIALETKDNHHQHHQHGSGHSQSKENGIKISTSSPPPPQPPKEKLCAKSLNDRANDYSDTAQSLLNSKNHNNIDDGSMDLCGCEHKKTLTPENYTVILREHESQHHGHSHTHGHVHSPPKTLSAVAWMVVMGDGLHNFTDGMAIGAAFSNSITGGFSTAIAVFCHELPHELGDFAVLLKAGMSAKKAAYYNILSSVLSFLGMVLGVVIGDTPEASAWIFACAAGMFIYIALVDMMPELTTAHNEHSAILQCFIQFMGMIIGVSIMLLIALYEHDLKMIFDTNDSHHHGHDH